MKNYFTDGEISPLWCRLNTSIKSAGKGCAEMWDKLKNMPHRSGKNAAKQNALMFKLTKPDVWKEMMQSDIREFIRVDKLETQEVPKSKGEMEMIHGKEEAHELINKGWFNTVTIKGVTHYIKRTATKTQGTELRHTKKGEQRSSVDEDATQMMDSEFGSMAMTWDFDDAEKHRPCPEPLADAEEGEHQQARSVDPSPPALAGGPGPSVSATLDEAGLPSTWHDEDGRSLVAPSHEVAVGGDGTGADQLPLRPAWHGHAAAAWPAVLEGDGGSAGHVASVPRSLGDLGAQEQGVGHVHREFTAFLLEHSAHHHLLDAPLAILVAEFAPEIAKASFTIYFLYRANLPVEVLDDWPAQSPCQLALSV